MKTDVTENDLEEARLLLPPPPGEDKGGGGGWCEMDCQRSNTSELHYIAYSDDSPELYVIREDGQVVVMSFGYRPPEILYTERMAGRGATVKEAWLNLYERCTWPGVMVEFCQRLRAEMERYWPQSLL